MIVVATMGLTGVDIAVDMKVLDPIPDSIDIDVADNLEVFLPGPKSKGTITMSTNVEHARLDYSSACPALFGHGSANRRIGRRR